MVARYRRITNTQLSYVLLQAAIIGGALALGMIALWENEGWAAVCAVGVISAQIFCMHKILYPKN